MKLNPLTNTERHVVLSNPQLERYLDSLNREVPATERSWLYENIDNPDTILDMWLERLARLENGSSFEQEVFTFDTAQVSKWGPQGGHPPIADAMDIVTQGFGDSPSPKAFSTASWQKTKLYLRSMMLSDESPMRPKSYEAVLADMQLRDTLWSNSGWPLFARRQNSEVKQLAVKQASGYHWDRQPAIALFRNYNQKLRLVWMYPFAVNLVEGSYTQLLQQRLLRNSWLQSYFIPWIGFEAVRDRFTDLYAQGRFIAASDFSATDAHFTIHSTDEVYDVIGPVFQEKYRARLQRSLHYMHEIDLVISSVSKLSGLHGVSSGSNWTNLIETVFDLLFSDWVTRELGDNVTGQCGIGDDMAWSFKEYDPTFATSLERLGEEVGQSVKAEKTTNDRDKVKFLQRLFQRGYNRPDGKLRAVYSTVRALKSSVFPERWHDPRVWSKDMFAARQFMILENCVDHPLFEEFVKFVCSGNGYLVPFAKQSESVLQRIQRETKLLPGLNPTYNQEKAGAKLSEFTSIQLARTL